jgi:MFS family permease
MASILPVLVILFAGSISDQYGRKLPMTIVLGGFVLYSVIYIITALNPSWPVEVLFAATIAVNATGSWVVFNMAVYSYLADITSAETRTKRMGWMDAVWYMGGPIGTVMGGWLYKSYGTVAVFAVSGTLWFFCIIYVVVVVKESIAQPLETTPKEKRWFKQRNVDSNKISRD